MKLMLTTIAVFSLSICTAQCGVYVTNIALTAMAPPTGTNYFTVPAGKSLYIEHIYMGVTNRSVSYFHPLPGGLSYLCFIALNTQFVSFQPPLKLDSGRVLQVSDGAAIIYGLIVDDADVYAAVSSEFQTAHLAPAGGIQGTLSLRSPRPALVKMEASKDLQTWFEDQSNVFATRASEPAQWNYTAVNPEAAAFFRAKARSRDGP